MKNHSTGSEKGVMTYKGLVVHQSMASNDSRYQHIWSEHRSALEAFLHSRVGNASDVDDLLQDILIKIYRNLSSVKEETSLRSWLFQIAQNTIIDYYRRQKQSLNFQGLMLRYDEQDENTQHSLEQCVAPFINALPLDQRDLLTAIYLEGQSQKEFAASQGIAYSTLKSRVKRGREAMRDLFENCCHLSLDSQGNVIEYQPKSDDCGCC